VLLDSARLSADSSIGYRRGPGRGTVDSSARFGVNEIARFDERRLDERRTPFVTLGALLSAALALAAAAFPLATRNWDD
jgi:hypothetical protein